MTAMARFRNQSPVVTFEENSTDPLTIVSKHVKSFLSQFTHQPNTSSFAFAKSVYIIDTEGQFKENAYSTGDPGQHFQLNISDLSTSGNTIRVIKVNEYHEQEICSNSLTKSETYMANVKWTLIEMQRSTKEFISKHTFNTSFVFVSKEDSLDECLLVHHSSKDSTTTFASSSSDVLLPSSNVSYRS